jgi:uncharacterized protein with PIN domain
MRFLVDINAGGLTRWLRAMGYDTLCLPHAGDGELAGVALREGRVLVTRDSELPRRRDAARGRLRVVLVRDQDVMGQLRQVVGEMGLRMEGRAFTLCLRCNVALRDRPRETVEAAVPPYVFQTHRSFKECPGCGRLYWQGTHWERMRLALAGVVGAPEGSAP